MSYLEKSHKHTIQKRDTSNQNIFLILSLVLRTTGIWLFIHFLSWSWPLRPTKLSVSQTAEDSWPSAAFSAKTRAPPSIHLLQCSWRWQGVAMDIAHHLCLRYEGQEWCHLHKKGKKNSCMFLQSDNLVKHRRVICVNVPYQTENTRIAQLFAISSDGQCSF